MNPRPPPCEGDALPAELLPHDWKHRRKKAIGNTRTTVKCFAFVRTQHPAATPRKHAPCAPPVSQSARRLSRSPRAAWLAVRPAACLTVRPAVRPAVRLAVRLAACLAACLAVRPWSGHGHYCQRGHCHCEMAWAAGAISMPASWQMRRTRCVYS